MRSRGLTRSLVPMGLAVSTIGAVALSTTAIGLTTETTATTTRPLQLVAPTTTRPSSSVSTIGAVALSATAIGLTTETTTTTTRPLQFVAPTTTRPSSAPPTTTTVPTTATIAPVLVQPTTTTTTTAPAPPTVPPVIVDATTTTVTTPPTPPTTPTELPAPSTTRPASASDVFVEDLQVTQGLQDHGRMPLVAGKSSTWVRVSVVHSGGGDIGAVDGALLVERAGQSSEEVLADDEPEVGPGGRRTFRFRLEPHHLVAGELKLSFTLFRPDGTPVDDSPDDNSIARVVEFHAARVPTLFVFVPHDLDPTILAELLAEISDSAIATLPAAAIDVELLPIPQTASDDADAWREVVPQIQWTFEQFAEPGDQPVIIGRVYDPSDDTGREYGVFRLVSRPSDGFEYPGEYAQRFDGLEYCVTLDALGVPCDPADLGLASSASAPRCAKEIDRTSVLLAGPAGALLQEVLDCIDDDTTSPSGPASEHAGFIYSSISMAAAGGGWITATGELAAGGSDGSIGTMTFSDELPSPTALRLGAAVEAAFTGSDALTAYLRLVDADGRPLVGAPASSPYLQLSLHDTMVTSYSATGAAPSPSHDNDVSAGFIAPIPWVDGAVALEIVAAADGTVLDSMTIGGGTGRQSGSDQTATVGSNQTITVGASQSVTVGWDADTLPDGSAVDVFWSADGSTWIPAAVGVTGGEVILKNASYLPRSAGDEAHVMVVPSGVLHTDDWETQGVHQSFRLAAAPPLLVIAGVPDEPIDPFEPIELHAVVATSALQGDPIARYHLEHAWPSAPDDPPAHTFDGRLLTARDLPPGEHVITFTLIDSATGLSISKDETITVSGARTESTGDRDVAISDSDA